MVRLKNLSWIDKNKLKIQINHDDQVYHINLKKGHDLSICAEFSNFASSKIVETFGPRLTPEGYAAVLNKLKKS